MEEGITIIAAKYQWCNKPRNSSENLVWKQQARDNVARRESKVREWTKLNIVPIETRLCSCVNLSKEKKQECLI
jgi:hypothetical protein